MKAKVGAQKKSMLLDQKLLREAKEVLGARTLTETVEESLRNTVIAGKMLRWMKRTRGTRKGKGRHLYGGE